ncbi:MAG: helix-turn-helix domain-containing protein [Bdellovibrionota bacterium]
MTAHATELTALDSRSAQSLERDGIGAFHQASFVRALELLQRAALAHLTAGHVDRYIECTTYVLRILAEREEFAKIDEIEKRILVMIQHETLTDRLLSRVHYMLGVCQSVRIPERAVEAGQSFERSIHHALESQDRRVLAYPIYGHAFLAFGMGSLEQAKLQLDRLQLILDHVYVADLEIGSHILRGLIFRNEGQFEPALAEMWKAYQALREQPNVVLYVHALHGLGSIYLRKGDYSIARHYIDLASGALKEVETPRLAKMVGNTREKLDAAQPQSVYDFCLETEAGVIYDKQKKPISLHGQFVLRDLALLFFGEPERVYKKAELVERIWAETYDPSAHDNRIYVTIRRLRRILEDEDRTKESLIVRAKGGYRLNPSLRVKVV